MKKLLLLLVALFASLTATAQYVAIYASPYSSGMVQVGTDNNMGPLLDGSSMTIVEAGQTVYFSFQPFSGYKFNGIRYKNLSSDDVTELPGGIYSFIMPDFTGDNFWVTSMRKTSPMRTSATGCSPSLTAPTRLSPSLR